MKNILVTGGAGFIGSNFIRHLLSEEPDSQIVNLDALTYAGSLENLRDLPDPERHVFIHNDICDRNEVDAILDRYEIDTIVHFAAESHVDRSIIEPETFIHTNVSGTCTLLEAARSYWLSSSAARSRRVRFHHVSTDEVHGSLAHDEPAWTEDAPYAPNSPYAASKAASDHLVRSYGRTYGLPYTLSYCSNNYGPRQFPEKLIPLTIFNAIEGREIPVYGDGMQIRDWLYVGDHCEAILQILRKGVAGRTYNIGGNNQTVNLAVVQTICDILDELSPKSPGFQHRTLITFVKDRPGHDRRYALCIDKIQRELGWQPRKNLEEGLRDTVAWYLKNTDWITAIRQQPSYKEWLNSNYTGR